MKVVVIGGGASGMMAALCARESGAEVLLLEKNEKLGKKIYITGKGRCNLTNNCEITEFLENVVSNPKFLMSSLYGFSPSDTIAFFEGKGLTLKTERGGRVFPSSDKASDVTKCLEMALKRSGVSILFNHTVNDFVMKNGKIEKVLTNCGDIMCDKVILCSGGVSYPTTGSTGDGYRFAKKIGHKIIEPKAGLIGLVTEPYPSLAGLALKNVNVSVVANKKSIASEFGEMLFTHVGVSGPCILTLSSKINRQNFKNLTLSIDLKPALSEKELDLRVQRDFAEFSNKQFANSLDNLLPHSLISVILGKSEIEPYTKVNQIPAEKRRELVNLLKNFTLKILDTEKIEQAIVTAGGIDTKEIHAASMKSKICENLYFAGEIIDVDALTGGFNLQIAFSTGYLAGKSCTEDK